MKIKKDIIDLLAKCEVEGQTLRITEQLLPNCDVIELHEGNRKTLTEKGFSLVHDDFLTFVPEKKYTAIVMNPPFSKGQDIAHTTKAIEIAERVVVAVASASIMFRNDNKTVAFRELVASYRGTIEELPADSFKESGTPVRTCLIVVKK